MEQKIIVEDVEEKPVEKKAWPAIVVAILLGALSIYLKFSFLRFAFLSALAGYFIGLGANIKKDGFWIGMLKGILVFPAIFNFLELFFSGEPDVTDSDHSRTRAYEAFSLLALIVPAVALLISIFLPLIRLILSIFV